MMLLLCIVYTNRCVYSFASRKDNNGVFCKDFIVDSELSDKITYRDVNVYF